MDITRLKSTATSSSVAAVSAEQRKARIAEQSRTAIGRAANSDGSPNDLQKQMAANVLGRAMLRRKQRSILSASVVSIEKKAQAERFGEMRDSLWKKKQTAIGVRESLVREMDQKTSHAAQEVLKKGQVGTNKTYRTAAAADGLTPIDVVAKAQRKVDWGKDVNHRKLHDRIADLAKNVRAVHYYDGEHENPMLESGILESSHRRLKKSKGAATKTSKTDVDLGNADHVFFFLEWTDKAKFRKTRFSDTPSKDGVLVSKDELTGDERRVSFPLREIMRPGTHGYKRDIGQESNPVLPNYIFSAESKRGVSAAGDFMLDLFRTSLDVNKSGNVKGLEELNALSDENLFKRLTRGPDKEGRELNPQILVPGMVSMRTRGVMFQKPADVKDK